MYCFTDLDNMEILPFISQHDTHIISQDTGQSQDEHNEGNIGQDIHNCVIHFEVEPKQEVGQDLQINHVVRALAK